MSVTFNFWILIVCWSHLLSDGFSLSPSTAYQSPNLLKGQHLRIIWVILIMQFKSKLILTVS
jgi:hypothetical protein